MAEHKILTVSELAGHLNIHRITVYRLLKSGALPGFKIGRVWRFDLEEITNWIQTGKAPQSSSDAAGAEIDAESAKRAPLPRRPSRVRAKRGSRRARV